MNGTAIELGRVEWPSALLGYLTSCISYQGLQVKLFIMSFAKACLLLYNRIHKWGAQTYFGVTTDEKISLSEVVGRGIKIKKIYFKMLYSRTTFEGGNQETKCRKLVRSSYPPCPLQDFVKITKLCI